MRPEQLVAEIRRVEADRADSLRTSGRMLAELHDAHGLSWPEIARQTGISQTTAYRRAAPFLIADAEPEA